MHLLQNNGFFSSNNEIKEVIGGESDVECSDSEIFSDHDTDSELVFSKDKSLI